MTDLDLDAIEARANAATRGPWWTDGVGASRVYADGEDDWLNVAMDLETEDAEFIAHARTDVPALIAEVRELQRRIRDASNLLQEVLNA